jgi:hypothetical protein
MQQNRVQVGTKMFQSMKLGLQLPSAERLALVPNVLECMDAPASTWPLVADGLDYTTKLPPGLWGMLGNDRYGCCFWSALANILMAQQANAGQPVHVYTTDDVLGWYAAQTGFKKNDPSTDNGTDPIAGMQWAQRNGLIRAWGKVPIVGNDAHLGAATEYFGGLVLGVSVPSGWMSTTTWGPNAGTIEGGHAIVGAGYNPAGDYTALTWAEKVRLLNAGKTQYGNLAIAVITDAWLQSTGQTLQGFNLGKLQTLLGAVA